MPCPEISLEDDHDNHWQDFIFVVRYLPKATLTSIKFALYGAAIGWGTGLAYKEGLNRFAQMNHEAIDINGSYVGNDSEFMHMSRDPHFNRVTPPISKYYLFIPPHWAELPAYCLVFVEKLPNFLINLMMNVLRETCQVTINV